MTKPGRNDPCPCGSGLKFKKCCGANAPAETAALAETLKLSESGRKSGWMHYPTRSYERMMDAVRFTDDLAFWTACGRAFGSPILCLACGLGREALHLAAEGFSTVGVDVHQGFIEVAQQRQQATALKADLQFKQADMVTMQLNTAFPLAIMATQSFQLLLTEVDQRAFLKNLSAHLTSKGVFIFDIARVSLEGKRLVNPQGERVGIYATDLDRFPRILNHGPLNQRLSTLDEIKSLLHSAGFEIFRIEGAPENIPIDFAQHAATNAGDDKEYTIFARKM